MPQGIVGGVEVCFLARLDDGPSTGLVVACTCMTRDLSGSATAGKSRLSLARHILRLCSATTGTSLLWKLLGANTLFVYTQLACLIP